MSIVPLVAVLVNSNMWMMYGYLDENYVPVFATFVAGDIIAATYVFVFYKYTKNRASTHKVIAVAALVAAATSTYVVLGGLGYTGQTRHEAAQVAGIIADITGMLMYASPLVKIFHVFRYKSAAFIPIHMVCVGSTNNTVWIIYSILAKKWLILVPSFGALTIGIFQLILYFFVYNPKTHPLPDELKTQALPATQENTQITIVIPSPLHDGTKRSSFVAVESPIPAVHG